MITPPQLTTCAQVFLKIKCHTTKNWLVSPQKVAVTKIGMK